MFIIIGIVVHRFPNPRTDFLRLKKWIDLVGLNKMDPNDVYKKKFICNNHFDEQSFSPGTKRLNAKSCPTLLLPGTYLLTNIDIFEYCKKNENMA